jgi:RNA polymerase sigma factor (sigma-70 family)
MTPLLSTPLLRAQSDGRLTALAASGHDRAFEAIVERYRRPLQRYLRRLLSEALAEDVLQATFVRAWQALSAGTEVRDLRPWLYRIAHNQAVNALRAAGSALPETRELAALSTEAEVEQREELRATLDGIDALPGRQRAAILAVAVADRPHADVAAELGLSDGALRQLLLRARSALRAAATAITPYPIVSWVASGQEVGAARVAEVAASAGGAGVAIKAGAAVLAAGAVIAGAPALRDEHVAAPAAAKRAHREHSASDRRPAAGVAPASTHRSVAAPARDHVRRSTEHRHHSGSRDDSAKHSASSGPGSGGSGSGASVFASRGPGPSGSGKDSDGGDDGATVTHGSSGSDGSGSGHSGSGKSGSGETESGESGSGSGVSGSGVSGSGVSAGSAPTSSVSVPVAPLATDDHSGTGPNDGGTPDGDDGSGASDGSGGGTSGHG